MGDVFLRVFQGTDTTEEEVHVACHRQTSETTSGEVRDDDDLRLLNSRLSRGYVIFGGTRFASRGSNVPAMAAESGPGRLSEPVS